MLPAGGGGAMSALVAGLRRAGSAHSLAAPRAAAAAARSLPPSPSHTPRKQSLEPVGNPFSGCGAAWMARARGAEGVAAALQPALDSALPPDALLDAARDSAPDTAARLSLQQIHDMLSAVREELFADDATARGGGGAGGDDGEARACALTALMLHCCAAAQLAQQRSDSANS
ncbi:hypothetical protein EVAR_67502_1 [Eumeta japonica]|uniref:Uncharacterized protein n=1 Tax=Eumeta variegata TaxID=151549 RepID=A0A4C1ZVB2_EUMVA|nr:hypothetical protein EVAR_67502_1 [Eumeta japonica]